MIGYRFLLPAEQEMTQAAIFYEEASPQLGVDFLDDVSQVIELLRVKPSMGQQLVGSFRRALLRRFPFNIIYSLETDAILVVAVAHQRRHPAYWRRRIEP